MSAVMVYTNFAVSAVDVTAGNRGSGRRSGIISSACIVRRLGRKVRGPVLGEYATVAIERKMDAQSRGGT
jgi:hypothetical protein